jgi:hypothetical protein
LLFSLLNPLCCELCEQLPVNPIESPIAENYHDIVFSQQRHQLLCLGLGLFSIIRAVPTKTEK